MKILVLNCGSSSLKYQFIDMENEKVLATGICERITVDGRLKHKNKINGKEYAVETTLDNHTQAIKLVIDALLDKDHGVISNLDEIQAVGHRVVHGGEYFSESVIVTDEVLEKIEKCVELAPLHNPANIMGIKACSELMPNVSQVVVFDTAFHQTLPKKSFLYALPYEFYEKHKIRRYGFHGTSYKYITGRASKLLGKDEKDLKLIVCHLGNGASVCAIENGKSVDTSMGFTPLEGLSMGTRSGDIDPAIISFIMEKENLSAKEVEDILNRKSGALGIYGESSDFRDIEQAALENNERAILALDIFCYKVAQYIGKYLMTLRGADAIVFTAGIGENDKNLREKLCKDYLSWLDIEIDQDKNNLRGEEVMISKKDSKIKLLVIPTNEELMIAKDTKELIDK